MAWLPLGLQEPHGANHPGVPAHGHPVYKGAEETPPDRNPRLLGPSSESSRHPRLVGGKRNLKIDTSSLAARVRSVVALLSLLMNYHHPS